MRNNRLRVINPVIRACVAYTPQVLCLAKPVYDKKATYAYQTGFVSQDACNPTQNGYGGYVQHDSREKKTVSKKSRQSVRNGEAKRVLGELITVLSAEEIANAKIINAVRKNPVLRNNSKLMGKIKRGLESEDLKYLKNLAGSM